MFRLLLSGRLSWRWGPWVQAVQDFYVSVSWRREPKPEGFFEDTARLCDGALDDRGASRSPCLKTYKEAANENKHSPIESDSDKGFSRMFRGACRFRKIRPNTFQLSQQTCPSFRILSR